MNKQIQALWLLRKEQLILGSFWLTVGGLVANLSNFIFNLVMGRLLTPTEYGTLVALLSLSFIISLPSAIVSTIVTKFTADFSAKKEPKKIARMVQKFTTYSIYGGIGITLLFVLFNQHIQQFFNINGRELIILTGIMIGTGLVTSINQGVYRGLLYFKAISLLGLMTVLVKLTLGWILVENNLAVFGALIAIFLSTLIPWIISFKPIMKYFTMSSRESMGIQGKILAFAWPTFAITAASTFYLNADLLLVKHFFSPHEAGIYAAASLMGKAIFYVLSPISMVLFSLVAQRFAASKSASRELFLSILITVIGGLGAIVIYMLFPDFIVKLFFPSSKYQETIQYVLPYGIYMVFYSIVSVLLNFFLAIEKHYATYVGFAFSLLQIVLIALYNDSLIRVINVSIISIGILAILLSFILISPLLSSRIARKN